MLDKNFNAEKIESLFDCGECVFCLSKCPKCYSVDVSILYHRQYSEDGDVSSATAIACKCGRTIIDEITIPKEILAPDSENTMQISRQDQYYDSPKLTKIFDKYFEDCKPKEKVDVNIVYEL